MQRHDTVANSADPRAPGERGRLSEERARQTRPEPDLPFVSGFSIVLYIFGTITGTRMSFWGIDLLL